VDRLPQYGPGQRDTGQVHRVYGILPRAISVNGNPNQGDPLKSPDVTVTHGCASFGRLFGYTLQAAVEAQAAAGIMMVAGAGNDGPDCSTVFYPPALYEASYTVGALNTGTDTVASFSSLGPVTIDGATGLSRISPHLARTRGRVITRPITPMRA